MGYYIQTGTAKGKATEIEREHGAIRVTQDDAQHCIVDPALAVIVVVDNGPFEAAAFAYNKDEFEAFTLTHDRRPKVFLVMDRKTAKAVTDCPY